MKILTLNMNMFNYTVDDSFKIYLNEINPDIVAIQECRYKRIGNIGNEYKILLPNQFSESEINNRIHLTLVLSKDKNDHRKDIKTSGKYDYTFLQVENTIPLLTAVHLPMKCQAFAKEYEDLLNAISTSDSLIVCGDFNASLKKKTENWNFLQKLISDHDYSNLWDEGLTNNKAFFINYAGNKLPADKDKYYRTYVGNTHIDYVLAKRNLISLETITIDSRTLAFTDHCGIITEFDMTTDLE